LSAGIDTKYFNTTASLKQLLRHYEQVRDYFPSPPSSLPFQKSTMQMCLRFPK
jgi:hypothetical protein